MARRIDIELTSSRDDGTWTWRAAGAKQPKGTLDAGVLYRDAKVGDVVRAEADFEVEGITILSVTPPRSKQSDTARIEYLGPPRATEPGVQLFSAGPPRREDGRRPPRRDGERGDRRDRRDRPDRGEHTERRDRRDQRGPRADRTGSTDRTDRRPRTERRPAPAPPAPKPKPKKLSPGRTHRDAVLAELPPEHRPIAEQVLRAGIPAVRRAVEAENDKAKAEGRPEIKADALVALAEELLPRLREAEWRDRADAAIADVDEIAIRDLRAVVTSAENAVHDDETRALAAQLRDALDRRLEQQRQSWIDEVTHSLDDGRVVRALRISGRPPEPGTKFPTELSQRLTEAAGQALAPDTPPERWATVLDAVASSPVRRTVKPAGLPPEPGDDLLAAAKNAAGRVPGVAELLGIEPPRPSRPPARKRPAPPPVPPTKFVPPGAPAKPSIGESIPASAPPASAPPVPAPPSAQPEPPEAHEPPDAPPAPTPEAPSAEVETPQATSDASTDSTR
jgi:hypothetical protein